MHKGWEVTQAERPTGVKVKARGLPHGVDPPSTKLAFALPDIATEADGGDCGSALATVY